MSTDPNMTDEEVAAWLQRRAAQTGVSVGDVVDGLGIGAQRLTVAEHVAQHLATLDDRTRDTYKTHLQRLCVGIGPVCDQTCEPCMKRPVQRRGDDGRVRVVEPGYLCRCSCAACLSSRLSSPALGHLPVSADTYSQHHGDTLSVIARRLAVKKGIVENRRRAERGLSRKMADGFGAEECAIAAFRNLYENASTRLCLDLKFERDKPRRVNRERRPLRTFELMEYHHATAMGGDDPELDLLLVDFAVATGVRRVGTVVLTMGALHRDEQIIDLRDKYKRRQPAPVSLELVDRLMEHARERGGSRCDPASSDFAVDAPVFYYLPKGDSPRPLTDRRFDTLARRLQRDLKWANQEQVAYHHLRHTIAAEIEGRYGRQYKRRFLRHADGNVTDGYGVCTFEELARVMSDLLRFEHPLVHGIDERRKETLRRLGMSDDD